MKNKIKFAVIFTVLFLVSFMVQGKIMGYMNLTGFIYAIFAAPANIASSWFFAYLICKETNKEA